MKNFFSLCVFLVGAAALAMPSGYSLGFYLTCFTALSLWLKTGGSIISLDARYFLWPLLAYGAGLWMLTFHEQWPVKEIGTYLPFGLAVFGFWGLRKHRATANWFWVGLAVGAVAAAAISGYQALWLGRRADGFTHAIQFGNIALLLGMLCLVRAVLLGRLTRLTWLLCSGFVAGLAASVWSQTRGGWLALLLIVMWIFTHATKGWRPGARVLVVLSFLGVLLIPAVQPGGVVQARIGGAIHEFVDYVDAGRQDTAVGARLAMWELAWENIGASPWLGAGDQGWLDVRDAAVQDGRLSRFSSGFTHVHNDYLNVVFKRGLVGLALYLALYLVPMLMFFKPYLHHPTAHPPHRKYRTEPA